MSSKAKWDEASAVLDAACSRVSGEHFEQLTANAGALTKSARDLETSARKASRREMPAVDPKRASRDDLKAVADATARNQAVTAEEAKKL